MHTVSFSFAFYIVLRPQGIRTQMKTLRKRHRVHIALDIALVFDGQRDGAEMTPS